MTYEQAKIFLNSLTRSFDKKNGVEYVTLPFDQFLTLEILAHQGAKVIPRPIADVRKDRMFFYMRPKRNEGWGVGLTYPTVSGTNKKVGVESEYDSKVTHGISLEDLPRVP